MKLFEKKEESVENITHQSSETSNLPILTSDDIQDIRIIISRHKEVLWADMEQMTKDRNIKGVYQVSEIIYKIDKILTKLQNYYKSV